ncbi:DOPA 4,5-dioxygenase family protein [Caballeronia sp. LZ062]|uniref:DOPA 4,5-dioxygenase family protein n=1 Tax=unclassified Caballeronia TaxID=2646786 RepID=UPI002861ACAB|nr:MULTISPECIES: DOPA 4,5-dioxygenase family protein [unclassified Caballeronia]MDR5857576.1 DOPA 4,5-dioxygenase family protein [Caballeronia sp. LZ050]MDR5869126.1 DOPA 4,5-dioxygenase family protein [Caballeronia sp. LZ062]
MEAHDTPAVSGWHAHVYFDAASRDAAWQFRQVIAEQFAGELERGALAIGRFHERPVGPHPLWSFQLGFGSERLTPMLEWLALNHGALDIFMHPNTGDDLRDHRDSAVWIGRSHELVLTAFTG